jgi:hypothetical protein
MNISNTEKNSNRIIRHNTSTMNIYKYNEHKQYNEHFKTKKKNSNTRRELYSRGKSPRYPLGGWVHPRANVDILEKRDLPWGKEPPVPIG